MIDIHSHLLPGLDDGSRSLEQSVAVLRRMASEGVTAVVLTPHLAASEIGRDLEPAIARRDAALGELRRYAPPEVELLAGFEILLDQPLSSLALGDRRLALAASRYYLVEFPLEVVGELATRVLRDIARVGVVPVVAHPERYQACSPATVAEWRQAGARMQVDAATLARPGTRGLRARRLVAAGLADVIAADNHGDGRSLARAAAFLRQRAYGRAVAEAIGLLTHFNPLALVRDWELGRVPPVAIAERWTEWLWRFLAE